MNTPDNGPGAPLPPSPEEILGFKRGEKPDEEKLKKAFRKLSMKWHPDRNPGDPGAERRFKEINEAHKKLKKELEDSDDEASDFEDSEKPGELVEAIVQMTDNAESFDKLQETFQLHAMVGGHRLRALDLPNKIDTRALLLIMQEAAKAQNEEDLATLKAKVDNFPFYTNNAYQPGGTKSKADHIINGRAQELHFEIAFPALKYKAIEASEEAKHKVLEARMAARRAFLKRIREVEELPEWEKLLAELNESKDFTDKERSIVRTQITVKGQKLRSR